MRAIEEPRMFDYQHVREALSANLSPDTLSAEAQG